MTEAQTLPGPLAGLRILELADEKGQFCGKLMGDLGADVIKIEPLPAGDPLRAWKENGYSAYWKIYARNKRSLGLNFRAQGASNLLRELALKADVLVEGFRPGTLEEMGLAERPIEKPRTQTPNFVVSKVSGASTARHWPGTSSWPWTQRWANCSFEPNA